MTVARRLTLEAGSPHVNPVQVAGANHFLVHVLPVSFAITLKLSVLNVHCYDHTQLYVI